MAVGSIVNLSRPSVGSRYYNTSIVRGVLCVYEFATECSCQQKAPLAPIRWQGWLDRPKSIILGGEGANLSPMSIRVRHIFAITGLLLAAPALTGCGTVNEKLAAGVGDAIPTWAGGMPADAPPRPGTAKYDEFMRERERRRLMPAAEREREDAKARENATEPVRQAQ